MAATQRRPGRWYTTREKAKDFLGIDRTIMDKDNRIDMYIAQMSRKIETETETMFIPWTGTKEFDFQGTSQLYLGKHHLLSVTTLQKDGTTITSANYFLYRLNAADINRPYQWVELLFDTELFQFTDTRQSAITIEGKWGWSEIVRDSGSLLDGAIADTTSTTVTVDVGTHFHVGQTILIGTEQMFVKNVISSANQLTVSRGLNGTTAATHSDNATINIIEPPDDIEEVCNVLVARELHRADFAWSDSLRSGGSVGDAGSSFKFNPTTPTEIKQTINRYRENIWIPARLMGRHAVVGRWPTN